MTGKKNSILISLWAYLASAVAFQHLSSGPAVLPSRHPMTKRPFQFIPLPLHATVQDLSGTALQEAELDWSFLDGVYLITCPNVDPNSTRLTRAIGILDSVGLADRVQVKEFATDDENRIRGCYTSHVSVLSSVLESTKRDKNLWEGLFRGFRATNDFFGDRRTADERNVNILVLEDNLALTSDRLKQDLLNSVAKYMATDPSWDVIHLSYIPYVPDLKVSRTDFRDIVKLSSGVGSALGTTAYIINTRAIKELLEDDKENNGFYLPIPDVMAKLFPQTRYATNPTIFVRAPNTKSLVNPQLDDLRELLFQPAVASFSQQVLLATGFTTNLLLPIVIILLLGASGASLVSTFESIRSLITYGDVGGPLIVPVVSAAFSLCSLAVLAKGAMLAPKQERT